MPVVRRLQDADHASVLHINAAHVPAVARLDATELRRLAAIGELHSVAVDDRQMVAGYLPPNPDSLAFHRQMGFTQLDAVALADGRSVVLLTRDTSPFD